MEKNFIKTHESTIRTNNRCGCNRGAYGGGFSTCCATDHTEQLVVAALRQAGALSLSLVAEDAGVLVGHVAASPVSLSDGTPNWYGIGPISVMPAQQRQGIGRANS